MTRPPLIARPALLLAALATLAIAPAGVRADPATQAEPPPPPLIRVEMTAPVPDPAAAKAWGLTASDIPPDPLVRWGVLANGMKYAVMRNTTPKGQAAVRLHIDVGSFAEDEDQQGLAHFLEHMAFNGSTNVPEGEMVKLLERKGLAFGADTNASTGFDQTIYQLDLPRTDDDLVDTALMLMREVASEQSIAPAAVDRERGVVLAERQARDNFSYRNVVDALTFTFPDTRAWRRLPIGTAAVIRDAPAQRIRDFYHAWYRPERATLVIVGDVDVDAMAQRIAARFGDWQGRGEAGAPAGTGPDIGTVDAQRPAAASVYVDPAITEQVTLTRLRAWRDRPDTRQTRAEAMVEGLATTIINRRLARLALAPDSPISGASLGFSRSWNFVDAASLSAVVKDGAWDAALALIDREWRAAAEHGFTDAELAETLANQRTARDNAVAAADTRRSNALAGALLSVADGRRIFSHPRFGRDLFTDVAAGLTAAQLSDAFRARMADYGPPLIRVTSRQPVTGDTDAVLTAWRVATQTATTAPEARTTAAFAYTDFGAAGRIVADDRIADLDIRRIRFANDVMLNIKRTDFVANRVNVAVRVDGGSQQAPVDDPARFALGKALALGGLGVHSVDDLRSVLAGRSVSDSWGVGFDGIGASVTTTPADLDLQMRLLAANMTDPGWRGDGLALLRGYLPQLYAAEDATVAAVIGRDVPAILANGDSRAMRPPLDMVLAQDWDIIRAATQDSYAHGAIEVGIVGAVDEDAAIAAVAASFGALPDRRPAFVIDPANRERAFAADLIPRTLRHRGQPDQAQIGLYWSTRDDEDLTESMQISLLMGAFRLLLLDELREALGKSYSPGAGARLSDEFPGYGYVFAGSPVDYGELAVVERVIRAIAAQLRDAPVSDDVLNRARAPLVEGLTNARRENGYWLGYVARATSEVDKLDRSRQAIAVVEAATAADLQALAHTYLQDDRALMVRTIHVDQPEPGSAP